MPKGAKYNIKRKICEESSGRHRVDGKEGDDQSAKSNDFSGMEHKQADWIGGFMSVVEMMEVPKKLSFVG